jgi:hypothetical protein
MKRHVWLVGIALVALLLYAPGCRKKNAAPVPVADHSLPAAEYTALGLPAADRVWQAADYTQAATGLANLYTQRGAALLPSLSSAVSGEWLAHLIDTTHLEGLADAGSDPASLRQAQWTVWQALQSIRQTYAMAAAQWPPLGDDELHLAGFLLRLAVLVPLAPVPGTPADPLWEKPLQELWQQVLGYLPNGADYSLVARGALAQSLAASLPLLWPHLPEPLRLEGLQRLQELTQTGPAPVAQALRPALQALAAQWSAPLPSHPQATGQGKRP